MIDLILDRNSDVPLYRQIEGQIREGVSRGDLTQGERLPTSRSLAGSLGINRLTVARAYSDLAKAGILSARVGRGTFVASGSAGPRATRGGAPEGSVAWKSLFARFSEGALDAIPVAASFDHTGGSISFASLFPDPTLFPVDAFRRAINRALRKEGSAILGYGPPAGNLTLRRAITAQLAGAGIRVSTDEIIVTNGSQQGIDLVARTLLDPGDVVLVENPTYTGAIQVFQSYGAMTVGVPVDDEGIVTGILEDAIARHRPKLIYVMPNFQNPTSETMSLQRRQEIVELARVSRIPILEDDFGGDLRFEGERLPALKSIDRSGCVIYLSTFAKKLLPGLRIGWIASPAEVADRLTGLKKITDYSTSVLLQAALDEFCQDGELERHVEKVVGEYRARRDTMVSSMERFFPKEVRWSRPSGGLAIWVTLPSPLSADEVASAAEARGVLVSLGDLFYVDGGTGTSLRLTFSQASQKEIVKGVRILGEIMTSKMGETGRSKSATAGEPLPLI